MSTSFAAAGADPRLAPLGDGAVTVTLGDRVELALNRRVHRLAAAVAAAGIPGVIDVVPAYATLSVFYEPLHTSYADVAGALAPLVAALDASAADAARETGDADATAPHVIPVVYDGPDLAEAAARLGLAPDEVVRRHAGRVYTVYLLGFVPGFAYLGDLDPRLALPRRASPRPRVPPGSVAIASRQTAVYPLATPGGWHLIGRTDVPLLDVARTPPTALAPGQRVRFVPT